MNVVKNTLTFSPSQIPADFVVGEKFSQDFKISDLQANGLKSARLNGDADGLEVSIKDANNGIINLSGTFVKEGVFDCQIVVIGNGNSGGVLNI